MRKLNIEHIFDYSVIYISYLIYHIVSLVLNWLGNIFIIVNIVFCKFKY